MNLKLSKKFLRIKFSIVLLILLFLSCFHRNLFALDYSYIGLYERSPFTNLDCSFIQITDSYENFLFHEKIFAVNKVRFVKNNKALIETDGSKTNFTIGSNTNDADVKINELITQDNISYKETAFLFLKDDKEYEVNVKVSEFEFKNSKIGTLIILEGDSNKKIVNINAEKLLNISNNTFLNSFIAVNSKNANDVINISGKDTNISDNIIQKNLKTKGSVIFGQSDGSKTIYSTIFSRNKTDVVYSGGYLVSADSGIKLLGKAIKIEENHLARNNAGGLFESNNGNIEIGDDNTQIIIIKNNKASDNTSSFIKSNNGNITFKAPVTNGFIEFEFDEKNWKNILSTRNSDVTMFSRDVRLTGSYVADISNSALESFMVGKNLKLDFGSSTISGITLKNNHNVFFDFTGDIYLGSTTYSWSNISIRDLKSNKDDYNGGIFRTNKGNIALEMDQFWVERIDAPGVWVFRQENDKGEDVIKANKIHVAEVGNNIAGFYYSKGQSFKMHGKNNENEPVFFEYSAKINGIAAIKIGSEESNAEKIQYKENPFFMNISDFTIRPYNLDPNVKAGIVFTNPRYIQTDASGSVIKKNGDLKILINFNSFDLNTRSLYFGFDDPSIIVVANKQNYGDGKSKRIFEFGETIIEGSNNIGEKKVRLNGYLSLQTETDDDFSGRFVNIKGDKNTVGNSKLTIGDNISEFDTASTKSHFVLHDFEMKSGKIRVYLDDVNKNRDLFEWAGDYKTLSNGAGSMDNIKKEGTIKFADGVTMDIDGDYPNGEYILVKPGQFNIDICDNENPTNEGTLKSLSEKFFISDDDIVLEKKEIVHADRDNGFVIKVTQIKNEELSSRINTILRKYNVSNEDIKNIVNNIDFYEPDLLETNYTKYLRIFYSLLKETLKGYEIDEDTPSVQLRSFRRFAKNKQKNVNDLSPVFRVLDNLQQPDENYSTTGAIGEIGLSSIKTVSNILDDRMSSFTLPTKSVESGIFMLADADNSNGYSFIKKHQLDIFSKVNFGFGKLKTTDGNRDIINFGVILGADFNLLKDNLRTGLSVMYDYNKLNGEYRKSNINSVVLSLYSKYDIIKLNNSDVFYTYGIVSYSYANESGEYGFIINFDNNSNNVSANIIAIDIMNGYKFDNLGIIPEFGFGFIFGLQNSYKDNLGQEIKSRSSNIISIKSNLNYKIPSKYLFDNLSIGLKIGLSYNVLYSGDKGFNVVTPNNFKYYVKDATENNKFLFNSGMNISYNFKVSSKLSFYYDISYSKNLINNKFSLEYRYSIR